MFGLSRFQQTKVKLRIARILYRAAILVYRTNEQTVTRNGITYQLDLREGVELALFLFGNFQKHVSQNAHYRFTPDATVIDVGANLGAITLPFAQRVPFGKVFAFEPSHYAFAKLKRNLELNPTLAKRIVAIQSFVSSTTSARPELTAYASWNVAETKIGSHPIHGGTLKSTDGVEAITLDDFARSNAVERVSVIKIDTDGHELDVLQGATHLLSSMRPTVVFELGRYLMAERGVSFASYWDYFARLDYDMVSPSGRTILTPQNYARHVPAKGTIDILGLPRKTEPAR